MGKEIKVIEKIKPSWLWWSNANTTILSFDRDIDKSYLEIKQMVIEMGLALGEFQTNTNTNIYVMSIKSFYYSEFEKICFCNIEADYFNQDDIKLVDSMFTKFCKNYGIFDSGFVIVLSGIAPTNVLYKKTIKKIKDEIIHIGTEF